MTNNEIFEKTVDCLNKGFKKDKQAVIRTSIFLLISIGMAIWMYVTNDMLLLGWWIAFIFVYTGRVITEASAAIKCYKLLKRGLAVKKASDTFNKADQECKK